MGEGEKKREKRKSLEREKYIMSVSFEISCKILKMEIEMRELTCLSFLSIRLFLVFFSSLNNKNFLKMAIRWRRRRRRGSDEGREKLLYLSSPAIIMMMMMNAWWVSIMENSFNGENSRDFNGISWQLNLKIMENKFMSCWNNFKLSLKQLRTELYVCVWG